MKKFFVMAAIAASMSLVACGGDKGNGADSDSVAAQKTVEAVTGNPEADALIAKINACTTLEELQTLAQQNQAVFAALPADVQAKVDALATEKAQSFVGALQDGTTEVVEEVTEVAEVPADAAEAAQTTGSNLVDKAKATAEDAAAKTKAAAEDVAAKTKAAAEDVAAKTKAAGEDAAAKAKAAAKSLGL